jgi:hypothetical protein
MVAPPPVRWYTRRWIVSPIAAIVVVVGVVFLWPRSPTLMHTVTVIAVPAVWTPIDLSTIPDGASVAISGTGPFSIQLGSGAPVPVTESRVDLGSFGRSISVQPEGNEAVQVVVEATPP